MLTESEKVNILKEWWLVHNCKMKTMCKLECCEYCRHGPVNYKEFINLIEMTKEKISQKNQDK